MSEQTGQFDDWWNVLFSISNTKLTDQERDALANIQCFWVLLNSRLGRYFIDIIGPKNRLVAIGNKLTELGRDPIVIGRFDRYGVLYGAPNVVEWRKVAQDVVVYDAAGNEISRTRPTAFVNTHQWAGWGEKQV